MKIVFVEAVGTHPESCTIRFLGFINQQDCYHMEQLCSVCGLYSVADLYFLSELFKN